jgi:hypothetical protein
MATIFDKPIAATPQSQFAALPLQFIAQAADRREQKWYQNKADADKRRDQLLQTNSLAGDTGRQQGILQAYDQRMDALIEEADGDYSGIKGGLDVISQDMRRDLSYGELGQINKNFAAAMADKENLQKLYQTGKISDSGYKLGLQKIAQHKTSLGDNNQWAKFQGYTPSNITDVKKVFYDNIDEINAKYSGEGTKFLSQDDIIRNVGSTATSNPGIVKAMQENWQASGEPGTFQQYFADTVTNIVQDKAYQEELKVKDGGVGAGSAMVINNVPMPNRTRSGYTGGSANYAKAAWNYVSGANTTKDFTDWKDSETGKSTIAWMEASTGTKMPEDYIDATNWIEDNLGKSQLGSIVTAPASESKARDVVTKEGFLNTEGAVYDEAGNLMEGDDIRDIEGVNPTTKNVTRLHRIVKEGGTYPVGTYIIIGNNGKKYYQEPTDLETLHDPEYGKSLINMAKTSATGKSTANLKYPILNKKTLEPEIKAGNYETRSTLDKNSVALYQNGELKYILDSNGAVVDMDKNKTE